jgi:hypothetical protein
LARLADPIRDAVPEWSLAEVVTALRAMRGIDLVGALTVLAEIGDLSRFQNPRQLMGFSSDFGLLASNLSAPPKSLDSEAGLPHAVAGFSLLGGGIMRSSRKRAPT